MRFKDIQRYKVSDLLLDEDNYRFMAAQDQPACVQKIFAKGPANFKNMMTSIAEDDLGELLLVYQNEGKHIVLDGNRRLAAFKALSDPSKYAPSEAMRKHAEALLSEHVVDFSDIQAQVSNNKQLIYKTVYERHAAGQGKSRIDWTAYSAARFRYDQQTEDSKDWYAMAVLLETERKYPVWADFIDSKDYSHEVFRRIFKSALDKGVISRAIFSDRNQRIKTSVSKKLLSDAIEKTNRFLEAMQAKDFSLSRNGKYADKAAVDEYMDDFELSPDNIRTKPPEPRTSEASTETKATGINGASTGDAPISTGDGEETESEGNAGGFTPSGVAAQKDRQGYGIDSSDKILQKLEDLESRKLIGLYKSMCAVSLVRHPQLLYTGAWSFFESLSTLMGKPELTSFESYLGSKMNEKGYTRIQKKDFSKPVKDICDSGNLNKHSGTYHSTSAYQLREDFNTLEPFICDLLDILISNKKKEVI